MKLKSWHWLLLILLLLIGLGAGAAATGLVNFHTLLAKVPFLSQNGTQTTNAGTTVSDLRRQNAALKKQVTTLQQQLNQVVSDQLNGTGDTAANSGTGAAGSQTAQTTPLNQLTVGEQRKVYSQLADYYAAMKPAVAVAILSNQDEQTEAWILHEMDQDQASPILSSMSAAQAAKLLGMIAEIDNRVNQAANGGSQ